jgi:hypothetical protein
MQVRHNINGSNGANAQGETIMSRKLENGAVVNPDNMTTSVPQSTQEDVASLRESLTAEIQAVATALPQLDIKVNPKVNENGTQEYETRMNRKGETLTGRALFSLSFASPFSAGRTVIVGNSSEIRSALLPFLADPSIAEAVKDAKLAALAVKRIHARNVLAKIEREIALLS